MRLEASKEGVGSTFIATIDPGPLEVKEFISQMSVTDILDSPSDLSAIQPSQLHGVNVLVVEDSEENRDLFACYLETAGAEVTLASDGREGVERRWRSRLMP